VSNAKEVENIRCRKILEDKEGRVVRRHGKTAAFFGFPAIAEFLILSKYRSTAASRFHPFLSKANTLTVPLNGKYDIGFVYDMVYDGDHTIWTSGYGIGALRYPQRIP
jgi:hypothetical protein